MNPQKINRCPVLLCLALACNIAYAERADRDKPMHLEANQVSIDDAKQISTFVGNVVLIQGTMIIRGERIVVTQSKEGFKHGVATGQPASFRQKRDGVDEYAEGDAGRIEFDTQEETVDLFGQAHMKQGQDEVRGEHITYNSKTELLQVQGGKDADKSSKHRVRAIIQPKGKASPVPPEPLSIKPADALTQPRKDR